MTTTWLQKMRQTPEWRLTVYVWVATGLIAAIVSLPLLIFTSRPADEVAVAVAMPLALFIQLPSMWWRWRGLFELPSAVVEAKPTITWGPRKWTPPSGSTSVSGSVPVQWSPVMTFLLSVFLRAMALLLSISLVVAAFIDSLVGLDWAVSFTLGVGLFFGWAAFGVKNAWFRRRTIKIPVSSKGSAVQDAVGLAERIFGTATPAQP